MEQTQNPKQTICRDSRLYCQSDSCAKPCINYCSDHGQVLCDNCSVDFHGECNCDQIPDKSDVAESLDVIKTFLNFIQENSEHFKSSFDNNNFDEELMIIREMHEKIDEKFKNLTEDNEFYELSSIMKEVNQLQKALIESNLLAHFSKIKELRQAVAAGSLSRQMITELQIMLNDVTQIEERKCNKLDAKFEEEKLSFKQTSPDLVQTNQPTEYKQCNEQVGVIELEQQINFITDSISDKIKQNENNIFKQEQEIQSIVFSRIYERNLSKTIPNISNFCFEINPRDNKYRKLIKDLENTKLRLPNLREVHIGDVLEGDADLVRIISNCTPSKIEILKFYISYSFWMSQKPRFYIRFLPKIVSAATKQMFLFRLEFNEVELEQIIRASHNVETLIIEECGIHCSTALDFGSALKYNTKTLSFQYCGNTDENHNKTDWKSDPDCFDNIIEAISNSGLRDSLQTISIYANQTLSVEKTQQSLNEKGMSHIKAV